MQKRNYYKKHRTWNIELHKERSLTVPYIKHIVFYVICFMFFLILGFNIPVIAQSPTTKPKVTATPTPLVPPQDPNVGINLGVSPVFINLATDPGKAVSSQIRIRNNNNIREYLQLDLLKFQASNTGETPQLVDVDPQDEFLQWIDFSEKQFTVDPNETKNIKFTVTPSQDAALGYYYAIVVNRIKEGKEGKIGATIAGAPAISLLLSVRSPNAKRELQLVDFTTDKLVYEELPVEFRVRVKNTGNIHIIPFGDIFIDWGSQESIGGVQINPGRGNILPGSERTYRANWEDGFMVRVLKRENGKDVEDKNGNKVYETKWDFAKVNKLRIGKYTANLLFVYDNGERDVPLEAKVSFWVIPWKILAAVLVLIFFILVGIKNTVSSLFRRKK